MAQATFTPREIDDLLANPDIGWQTFHKSADSDKNLPDWLPSSVYYIRFRWNDVEPTHGDYRFDAIEKRIEAATSSGQTLAFRVMAHSTTPDTPYHPAWLPAAGGRIVRTKYEDRELEIPDLDDPRTLEIHLELIRQLGRKYDGDPRISHVDLGSVGWWGEWHMSGSDPVELPRPEVRRKIVDTYLEAFKTTPLLMLIGGGDDLAYATARGTGWRADCLGDLGGVTKQWCHMRKGYPGWFAEARLHDAWKRAPVAYESCWDARRWVQEGWSLRYIFNYALATHASVLNNKSAPLPEGEAVRAEIERFVRRLGYRIVLRSVEVKPTSEGIEITSSWQNVGSAPIYQPARVQWQLRPAGRAGQPVQLDSGLAVSELMPGEVEVFTPAFLENPPDLPAGRVVQITDRIAGAVPPGEYELRVCLWYGRDPRHQKPIRLAIEGRHGDGWYTLGKVVIR